MTQTQEIISLFEDYVIPTYCGSSGGFSTQYRSVVFREDEYVKVKFQLKENCTHIFQRLFSITSIVPASPSTFT
jgi:hypothetical protein